MKTSQPIPLRRVKLALDGVSRAGAVLLVAAALGLGGCGGGDDDEAGTPLVPVTPSSAANAEAASAPAAGAQR
jgi:hypothetical protein